MKHIQLKQTALFIFLFVIIVSGLLSQPSGSVAAQVATPIPTIMSNTSIKVGVPTAPVKIGDEFDIPVTITTDIPSWGAQFQINYDQTLLEITSVDEGGFYKDWADANGASGMTMPKPSADNKKGIIPTTAFFLVGAKSGQGPSGSGTLMVIHAKALKDGTVELKLSEIVVNDSGVYGGSPTELGGIKAQNGIISIGSGVAVQPTAGGLQQATAAPTLQNLNAQPPTIERLVPVTSEDKGQGGIPWVIILPLLGALVIGVGVFLVTRKK